MNKEDVQQRVLQNGKPLDLDKFKWDEETNTFSSYEPNLILDFKDVSNCTFNTEYNCIFKTGAFCTFNTESSCIFNTGANCIFETDSNCIFKTGFSCIFNTGAFCTFKTESNCKFKTGSRCTFKTGFSCIFHTGAFCTFNTGAFCTFNTRSNCTFETRSSCTFDTRENSVVVRRDIFEVIQFNEDQVYTLAPNDIPGYLVNGIHSITGKLSIVADGILSEIISKKETEECTVYRVINYNKSKESFLIQRDDMYSHGKTLKEAKDSLLYKISSRDTFKFDSYTLETELDIQQCVECYRVITGACESGTRSFVENSMDVGKTYTVKQLIKITKRQYESNRFKEFFIEEK